MMVMACALGSMAVIGAIASTDAVNAGKIARETSENLFSSENCQRQETSLSNVSHFVPNNGYVDCCVGVLGSLQYHCYASI